MRDVLRWTGPHGVPSRITVGTWTDMAALERRGCGAWVGDRICGAAPTELVVGGTDLMFATYVSATVRGLAHAFLCALHDPGRGVVNGRLIADMRQDILRDQRREFRKFWRRRGEGRPYPLPNLLEPESQGGEG